MPKGFKYSIELQPRFADFDMMKHLNNAIYITYFELARLKYFEDVLGWDFDKLWNVVAKIEIDYKIPLLPKDKPKIFIKCSYVGNKSFILTYLLVDINDETKVYSKATSVQVCVEVGGESTTEIPSNIKKKIEEFEDLQ